MPALTWTQIDHDNPAMRPNGIISTDVERAIHQNWICPSICSLVIGNLPIFEVNWFVIGRNNVFSLKCWMLVVGLCSTKKILWSNYFVEYVCWWPATTTITDGASDYSIALDRRPFVVVPTIGKIITYQLVKLFLWYHHERYKNQGEFSLTLVSIIIEFRRL